ncbi:MAG: Holliday junction branch migration protein RuvA [Alphaproteobacteria bacterium]|nr:Holliday junction branch migration protein RuvA [Alphaproteobacteria bacterium]
MIAKLTGVLDSIGADGVVIDVGGVGYAVYCPSSTLGTLGAPGSAVSLLIETHVREDHIHLYGFANDEARSWFRLLQTVQGIGAKVALAILAALSPAELVDSIVAQDHVPLTKANGVGAKLAKRVTIELKDRVAGAIAAPVRAVAAAPGADVANEAVSALVNLGYRRIEAFTAVSAAKRTLGGTRRVEDLIRASLQELSR